MYAFLFFVFGSGEQKNTKREICFFLKKKIVIYLVYKQEAKTEFRKTK